MMTMTPPRHRAVHLASEENDSIVESDEEAPPVLKQARSKSGPTFAASVQHGFWQLVDNVRASKPQRAGSLVPADTLAVAPARKTSIFHTASNPVRRRFAKTHHGHVASTMRTPPGSAPDNMASAIGSRFRWFSRTDSGATTTDEEVAKPPSHPVKFKLSITPAPGRKVTRKFFKLNKRRDTSLNLHNGEPVIRKVSETRTNSLPTTELYAAQPSRTDYRRTAFYMNHSSEVLGATKAESGGSLSGEHSPSPRSMSPMETAISRSTQHINLIKCTGMLMDNSSSRRLSLLPCTPVVQRRANELAPKCRHRRNSSTCHLPSARLALGDTIVLYHFCTYSNHIF